MKWYERKMKWDERIKAPEHYYGHNNRWYIFINYYPGWFLITHN